jgi:hypothetical protein
MRLYFSTAFQDKTTDRPQQIKPPFQPKRRNPYQASLYAYNKQSRSGFRKTRLYFSTAFQQHKTTGRSQKTKLAVAKAARRCQSRLPLPKPLSVVKAALRCQSRSH